MSTTTVRTGPTCRTVYGDVGLPSVWPILRAEPQSARQKSREPTFKPRQPRRGQSWHQLVTKRCQLIRHRWTTNDHCHASTGCRAVGKIVATVQPSVVLGISEQLAKVICDRFGLECQLQTMCRTRNRDISEITPSDHRKVARRGVVAKSVDPERQALKGRQSRGEEGVQRPLVVVAVYRYAVEALGECRGLIDASAVPKGDRRPGSEKVATWYLGETSRDLFHGFKRGDG